MKQEFGNDSFFGVVPTSD
jgi:hypothetical protein